MKIVGGPRNGQAITISEEPGGPELQVDGMVLEYSFAGQGKVNVKISVDPNPKPSFPGLVERYKCHDGAWHYIPPEDNSGFQASPPAVME
jgi:hypothetical protein